MEQNDHEFTKEFSVVQAQEDVYISKRRDDLKLTEAEWKELCDKIDSLLLKDQRGKRKYEEGRVGIALSGGGIRSATFNLGILQALAKLNILRFCDYLSTVSGGGYIGSCLTSLLDNPKTSTDLKKFPLRYDRMANNGNERFEVKHLRDHGNFLELTTNPLQFEFWRTIGLYFSGFVSVNFFTASVAIFLTYCMYQLAQHNPQFQIQLSHWSNYLLYGSLGLLAVMILGRCLSSLFESNLKKRRYISNTLGILTWASALIAALGGFVLLALYLPRLETKTSELIQKAIDAGMIGSIVGFLIGMLKTSNKMMKIILGVVFRISCSILMIILFAVFVRWIWSADAAFLDQEIGWGVPLALAIALGLFIASLFIDVDRVSLHHFYRDRLSEAYLFTVDDDQHCKCYTETLLLQNLHSHSNGAPYHLINATLNIPSSTEPRLRGRKADFFLFSKHYCGAPSTGYRKTEKYNGGNVRLATAMAISGAAASPQMGELLSGTGTFFLTLLNIRLNRWMPNPNHDGLLSRRVKFHAYYFIKELFDRGKENDRMLNLSDGGHIENLALYELIKRRCSLIIASDAGADPDFFFGDLANFIRKVRIDLGAEIHMDLKKLRQTGEQRTCELHYATGTIEYANGTSGVLIYVKASINGNEPEDVLGYRRNNATFPDQTTLDQIFEEDQFESYRALGYFAGKQIFSPKPVSP